MVDDTWGHFVDIEKMDYLHSQKYNKSKSISSRRKLMIIHENVNDISDDNSTDGDDGDDGDDDYGGYDGYDDWNISIYVKVALLVVTIIWHFHNYK